MFNKNLPLVVKKSVRLSLYHIQELCKKSWVRIGFAGFILFLLMQKQLSFHLEWGNSTAAYQDPVPPKELVKPVVLKEEVKEKSWWEEIRDKSAAIKEDKNVNELNLANPATAVGAALTKKQQIQAAKFSNLGFVLNPKIAKKYKVDPKVVRYKVQKVKSYIQRFAPTAQEEARLYGIPASITLAQGLLESNVGDSKLAKRDNNHFGIKCKSKCIGCRCANYTDDSRYDMFRIYTSAWESYRSHSKLLCGKRYKPLHRLKSSDYKGWAHGLKKAGYATDKRYGYKLIQIIEALELYRYDINFL